MELRDYLRILRKGWLLILAITVVAIGAAAAYSFIKTPEYSATAKVVVSVQGGNANVSDLVQGNTFTQNRVKTYAELVTTPIVLNPVIEQLNLDMTVTELAAAITATAPLDTSLIQIDAASTDPAEAADIANAASLSLADRVDEIEAPDSTTGVSPVKITQVTDALVPLSPVSPNIPLNIALGALIGLALGVGIAVLRETLDTRIRNEHDVNAISETPIVGGIAFDAKASERPLIVQADPRSIRAESFRALRTNFQFLGAGTGGDRRSTFVFTSSVQAEGKTTTVANLAIALSDAGRSVVVVDADLRRPRLADMLGLEGAVGLSDLLIGRASLNDIIQPWGSGSLDVLPAGRIPPNPSELLGSSTMHDVIRKLEERYEYVLFDAAPLLPVTDAAVLSTYASGTIIVVAAGRTRKAQLRGTLMALLNVETKPVGFVITMLPTKGPDAYSYGYGYGYIADSESEANTMDTTVIPRPAALITSSIPIVSAAPGPRRGAAAPAAVDPDPDGTDAQEPAAEASPAESAPTESELDSKVGASIEAERSASADDELVGETPPVRRRTSAAPLKSGSAGKTPAPRKSASKSVAGRGAPKAPATGSSGSDGEPTSRPTRVVTDPKPATASVNAQPGDVGLGDDSTVPDVSATASSADQKRATLVSLRGRRTAPRTPRSTARDGSR